MRTLDPQLLHRTRTARPLLAIQTALGIATALVVLAQAGLLALIVATAFSGAPLRELGPEFGLLLTAFALRAVFAWGMEVSGRRAASGVLSELRLALVERRLRAQPTADDGSPAGEIAALAVDGVEALEGYFARYLPQAVLASVVPVIVIAGVAFVDLLAALIMLLTLPLVPVFMWLIGRYTEQRTRERWYALRGLSTHFLDVVRGLPTLRAFGRAADQAAIVGEVGERYRATTMETLRVSFLSGSVLELAATLGVALVAVTTGVRLVDGSLGLEAGLTVIVLASELYLPLRRLGAEFHATADGLALAERMFALLDAPAAAVDGGPLAAPSPALASVRLEHVSFSYPARPGPVLDGLDLELPPGETVALVGESGAGKSTVAALLFGMLEPTGGRILVGGVDLRSCEIDAWRRQIAWVPQQPTLLRGTIADNIRLADPLASDRLVRDAAAGAGADGFIRNLPDGYATVVGDGARPLSPGERRRIGLARAFLRDAALVILDEPTADLDPHSVAVVAGAVRRLRTGRSVLVIAHRPELIQSADRVVRLVDGVAVESAAADSIASSLREHRGEVVV
jgi:ATP-binding cassette, subfamily C, bacterial CydD